MHQTALAASPALPAASVSPKPRAVRPAAEPGFARLLDKPAKPARPRADLASQADAYILPHGGNTGKTSASSPQSHKASRHDCAISDAADAPAAETGDAERHCAAQAGPASDSAAAAIAVRLEPLAPEPAPPPVAAQESLAEFASTSAALLVDAKLPAPAAEAAKPVENSNTAETATTVAASLPAVLPQAAVTAAAPLIEGGAARQSTKAGALADAASAVTAISDGATPAAADPARAGISAEPGTVNAKTEAAAPAHRDQLLAAPAGPAADAAPAAQSDSFPPGRAFADLLNAAQPAPNTPPAPADAAPAGSGKAAAPAVPVHAIAFEIGIQALKGARRFDIRLDPAELGRVDVRLDVSKDGDVTATLTADRVETLNLLQREARTLERAFDQAGLKTNGDSLNFQMRQDGSQRQQTAGREGGPARRGDPDGRQAETQIQSIPERIIRRRLTGLDISI